MKEKGKMIIHKTIEGKCLWLQDREGLLNTQIALTIKENIDKFNNTEIKFSFVQQKIQYRELKKRQAKNS